MFVEPHNAFGDSHVDVGGLLSATIHAAFDV